MAGKNRFKILSRATTSVVVEAVGNTVYFLNLFPTVYGLVYRSEKKIVATTTGSGDLSVVVGYKTVELMRINLHVNNVKYTLMTRFYFLVIKLTFTFISLFKRLKITRPVSPYGIIESYFRNLRAKPVRFS